CSGGVSYASSDRYGEPIRSLFSSLKRPNGVTVRTGTRNRPELTHAGDKTVAAPALRATEISGRGVNSARPKHDALIDAWNCRVHRHFHRADRTNVLLGKNTSCLLSCRGGRT